jgi:hypothetical protein
VPAFIIGRRLVHDWQGDAIYSKFTSGQFLKQISYFMKVKRVEYVPNFPMTGMFAFFNRKIPLPLSKVDHLYGLFCRTTHFHWQVEIDAIKR